MTVYAYYRVSTEKQDYNSQKLGVVEYCNRAGLKIDKEVVDDGVSGTVKAKERKLWNIVKAAKKGDYLITSELSRLGRSTVDVLETCNTLAKKDVNVYFVKQAMGLDQSPMGKMMTAILSAFAEMERDLISQRTIEGLARAKAQGKRLGRPNGTSYSNLKIEEVSALAENGHNKTEIANSLSCSWLTIHRFCKKNNIKIVANGNEKRSKYYINGISLFRFCKEKGLGKKEYGRCYSLINDKCMTPEEALNYHRVARKNRHFNME